MSANNNEFFSSSSGSGSGSGSASGPSSQEPSPDAWPNATLLSQFRQTVSPGAMSQSNGEYQNGIAVDPNPPRAPSSGFSNLARPVTMLTSEAAAFLQSSANVNADSSTINSSGSGTVNGNVMGAMGSPIDYNALLSMLSPTFTSASPGGNMLPTGVASTGLPPGGFEASPNLLFAGGIGGMGAFSPATLMPMHLGGQANPTLNGGGAFSSSSPSSSSHNARSQVSSESPQQSSSFGRRDSADQDMSAREDDFANNGNAQQSSASPDESETSGGRQRRKSSAGETQPDIDNDSGRKVAAAPLKRGNACLFCRKRKLKCDAERPRCHQCHRLNRNSPCVYDDMVENNAPPPPSQATNGKPSKRRSGDPEEPSLGPIRSSRNGNGRNKEKVKALECRVAELEALLRSTQSSNSSHSAQSQHSSVSDQSPSAAQQRSSTSSSYSLQPESMLSPNTEQLLRTVMANVGSGSGMEGSGFNQASGTQAHLPMPFVDPEFPPGFDWSSLDPVMNGFDAGFNTSLSGLSTEPESSANQASTSANHPVFSAYNRAYPDGKPAAASATDGMNVDGGNEQLVGGWFDPTDPPPYVRDKLLNLFFSHSNKHPIDIHIPRFYARLSKPKKDRPHPAWLFSMYLVASRLSDADKGLKSLQSHFLHVAKEQIQSGIDNLDRLLDVVRASNNLVIYFYSTARYHEAWIQQGISMKTAIMLGLHDIQSNDITKVHQCFSERKFTPLERFHSHYGLPPPRDGIELCEAISAWWQTFTLELAGSSATTWPDSLPKRRIRTPLPRPMVEYELGFITAEHDLTLKDVLDGKMTRANCSPSSVVLRMLALYVMQLSGECLRGEPEEGVEVFDANILKGAFPPARDAEESAGIFRLLSQRSARYRQPRQFARLEHAYNRLLEALPPAFANPIRNTGSPSSPHNGPPGVMVDIATLILHLYLSCTKMVMYDNDDWRCPSPESIDAAHRIVELTVMIPIDKYMHVDPYATLIWSNTCRMLLKEVKRCKWLGDKDTADKLNEEVDRLLEATHRLSGKFEIAREQCKQMASWRDPEHTEPDDSEVSELLKGYLSRFKEWYEQEVEYKAGEDTPITIYNRSKKAKHEEELQMFVAVGLPRPNSPIPRPC